MEFQETRLCANGQQLGGDLVFGLRLGFSGTPSDLLPVELQPCNYEKGDDAKMLYYLTDRTIVEHQHLDGSWSVKNALRMVASAQPPYHALIDTGALVTGLTNIEVAGCLLEEGLAEMDGVIFLDEDDRKMMLLRSGKVMKLEQCGVPMGRRFSFYDQCHTTGMDIKQVLNAKAALTLGKDMTFRDYAQGAFRMRGIGRGQVNPSPTPMVVGIVQFR